MADNPPTVWAGVPTSVDATGRIQLLPGSFVTSSGLTTALGGYLPLTGGVMTAPFTPAGMVGDASGGAAAAGQIGEVIQTPGNVIIAHPGNNTNQRSATLGTLTPGDWNVVSWVELNIQGPSNNTFWLLLAWLSASATTVGINAPASILGAYAVSPQSDEYLQFSASLDARFVRVTTPTPLYMWVRLEGNGLVSVNCGFAARRAR